MLLGALWALDCKRKPEESSTPSAQPPSVRIKMATTTSTENSGLLDILLPAFKEKYHIEVAVIAVGTGKALKLGENGDVDLVLVHSRQDEDQFVARGFGLNRKDLMANDFVIIGPANNPAQLNAEDRASEALRKIASRGAVFASRSDESGTHKKEKALWDLAGITPAGLWYLETGQGMAATIRLAEEKQGYCLADRGTYIACRRRTELIILCQKDPNLFNPYGIIAVNPAQHPAVNYAAAMKFINWLTSAEGQKIIGDYRIDGETLFYPNPE